MKLYDCRILKSEADPRAAAGFAGKGGKTLPVLFPFDRPRQKRQSRLSHGQNPASLVGAVGSDSAEKQRISPPLMQACLLQKAKDRSSKA